MDLIKINLHEENNPYLKKIIISILLLCFVLLGGVLTGAAFSESNNFTEISLLGEERFPTSNISALVILSFIAGILSFLSPCTLPILPAYFAVTFQGGRKRIAMMSIFFFLGLAFLFVLMGASASFIGFFITEHLFSLTRILGILVVIFGLMTLIGKGFSGMKFLNKPSATYFGSFIFGSTFALGWTPCIGPVLTGILILAAVEKTVYQGMGLLFAYALGLGSPLIIISTFFGRLSKDSLFWRILRGKGWNFKISRWYLHLHTTNLFSGILLIALGILMSMGYLSILNSIMPVEFYGWIERIENKLIKLF